MGFMSFQKASPRSEIQKFRPVFELKLYLSIYLSMRAYVRVRVCVYEGCKRILRKIYLDYVVISNYDNYELEFRAAIFRLLLMSRFLFDTIANIPQFTNKRQMIFLSAKFSPNWAVNININEFFHSVIFAIVIISIRWTCCRHKPLKVITVRRGRLRR